MAKWKFSRNILIETTFNLLKLFLKYYVDITCIVNLFDF